MILPIIEISQLLLLRQLLFVLFPYSGATCLSQSNFPTHNNTYTLSIADSASMGNFIPACLLKAMFPKAWGYHSSSISLFKTSYTATHAKTYPLPEVSLHYSRPYSSSASLTSTTSITSTPITSIIRVSVPNPMYTCSVFTGMNYFLQYIILSIALFPILITLNQALPECPHYPQHYVGI